MLSSCKYKTIREIMNSGLHLPRSADLLLNRYIQIDYANLNSRVALLYAVYVIIVNTCDPVTIPLSEVPTNAFERLFAETLLNLTIDYRELWLLENSLCILADYYFTYCAESKI